MSTKTEKKLPDTPFIKVVVSNRNPESEERSAFVGGNNVIINGKSEIKHYTIELEKEVSLPDHFVDQLRKRSFVGKAKDGTTSHIPMFVVDVA